MKNASRTIGITSVTSTLSPRRRLSSSSTLVWASTARHSGAGARSACRAVRHERRRTCAVDGTGRFIAAPAGQAQEDVFERRLADPQLGRQHAALAQPGRQLDEQVGGGPRLQRVNAGLRLDGVERAGQRGQRRQVESRRRRGTALASRRPASAPPGVPRATRRPWSMIATRSARRSASSR